MGVLVCALGAVFGWPVSTTNHGRGPWSEYSSKLMGSSWAWLAMAAVCCLGGRGWRAASSRGLAFQHLRTDVGDGVEERAGDARPVLTGDGHQERLRGQVGHLATPSTAIHPSGCSLAIRPAAQKGWRGRPHPLFGKESV